MGGVCVLVHAHAFCTRRIDPSCVAICRQWLSELTSVSLSEKVKLVSELELPGVTQASVAKTCGVTTSQVSRLSKKEEDLVRGFDSAGAIVAENEREKARRRMLEMLCFVVRHRN